MWIEEVRCTLVLWCPPYAVPSPRNKNCFDIVIAEVVWLYTCTGLAAVHPDIGRKRPSNIGGPADVEAAWNMYPCPAPLMREPRGESMGLADRRGPLASRRHPRTLLA